MIDAINTNVRELIRRVMGMPPKSVRPADQSAPAGGQTSERATVKVISTEAAGWASPSEADDGHGGTIEAVDVPQIVVCSVNFWGQPKADAAGIGLYSNAAFDRAASLGQRLQLSSSIDMMAQIGLGLLKVSTPRNLAGLADATWESRGQVDLTFNVIHREKAAVTTFLTADVELVFRAPDGVETTRTFEVTE